MLVAVRTPCMSCLHADEIRFAPFTLAPPCRHGDITTTVGTKKRGSDSRGTLLDLCRVLIRYPGSAMTGVLS